MEQFNAFTLRLTDYIIQNHPDRIMEKDFIAQRGEAAKQTFAECSRMGMHYEECKFESDRVLYRGLHFAPIRMIEEIVDTHYPQVNLLSIHKPALLMQMLAYVKPTLTKYVNEDNDDIFQGSEEYAKAYRHIKNLINQFLYNNGLQ